MKRPSLNFLVDLVSFATLVLVIATGVILEWVLPPGEGRRRLGAIEGHRELLGLGRHDWGDVHLWLTMAFIALMIVHVVLHWKWIKEYVRSRFAR